ncbi:YAP-binding/ALF4/Glomulin [Tirmania nivea]|nr:YAP-binding/ALF4/Glomulin [Tirmania nivea]
MYYPESPVTTTLTKVTVDKAIAAIETAASEIPAEDFISYSTILDVHLSYALEFFSREDQTKLLQALEKVLKENDTLAQNIAWDLIAVLLPFLDAPTPATAFPSADADASSAPSSAFTTDALSEITSTCLFMAAYKGNPREVYLKLLGALSSLSFTAATTPVSEDTDEPSLEPSSPRHTPAEARANGHRKFRILIMLLTTIHSRIATAFPSRFLSQSLTTLLTTFTRSTEELYKEDVEDIVSRLLAFVDAVQPESTKKKRRMTQPRLGPDGKPALPPRTSTAGSQLGAPDVSKLDIADENEEEKQARLEEQEKTKIEEEMQIRLLQSFVSHVVEVYVLRCPSEYANKNTSLQSARTPEVKHDEQPSSMQLPSSRGINLHLASRFLKSNKFLTGGVIESEISPSPSPVWKEILDTAYQLSITTKELQELCYSPASDNDVEELEEPKSPHGLLSAVPKFVDDIPLSKVGSLVLLASRIFEKESIVDRKIRIFPEHRSIVYKYLTKGNGASDIGVLDAVLFLGAWALSAEGGGFGEAPDGHASEGEEGWLMYLQTFALLSATSPSPLTRLLCHNHLAQIIHAHPDEATRLAYMKDTLEHCPFDSLKASIIGILKDEIASATTTGNTKPSIFATPLVLEELSMFLFPDLSGVLHPEVDNEAKLDWFTENYPVIMAIGNLWLFLLMRGLNGQKGVCGIAQWGERIEERWAGQLKTWLDEVASDEDVKETNRIRTVGMDVDIVRGLLERVEEVRKHVV